MYMRETVTLFMICIKTLFILLRIVIANVAVIKLHTLIVSANTHCYGAHCHTSVLIKLKGDSSWTIPDLSPTCTYEQSFCEEHKLSCFKGNVPLIGHNEIRNITASLLFEVCSNVATEPKQPTENKEHVWTYM